MAEQSVLYEVNAGVATIAFNRPDVLNALDFGMIEELQAAIAAVKANAGVRAVILTGRGKSFCAGGDIKGMLSEFAASAPTKRREAMRHIHRWLIDLITLDRPVLAAVKGYAVGAGMCLAMAADMIVAAENAQFAQSFVGVGLSPDFAGSYLLPRLVGMNRAKELTFLGEAFDARAAERWGLVNRVVPEDQVDETTVQLAQRLAQGPTAAIGLAKGMLNRSFETDLYAFLESEACYQSLCAATDDFQEGIQAFAAKRTPHFQGK